jgi:hypothetical protein
MSDFLACKHVFVAGETVEHSNARSRKHSTIVYCQLHECECKTGRKPCKGNVEPRDRHGGLLLCSNHNDSMNNAANRAAKSAAKKQANVDPAQDEQPVQLVVPQVERAEDEVHDKTSAAKKRKQVSTPVHERPVVAPAYQDEEGQGISDDEFRSHLGELNSQASPAVKQFGQALYDEDPDGAPVLTKKYSIEAGYGKLALPHKKTQFVGALKLVMMIDYYYTRAIDLEDEVKEVADPMDISLSIELFGCMFNVKTLHGALLTQSMLIDEHVGMINESKRYGYGRIMLWLPPYAMRALAGIVKPIDSVKDYLEELAASTSGLEIDWSLPRSPSRSPVLNRSSEFAQTNLVDDLSW